MLDWLITMGGLVVFGLVIFFWAHWTDVERNHPEGKFHRGWERVRARVFPDGKFYWRRPRDFTFQLSDDWTTLVGKREYGGTTATSLMRRVSREAVPTAVSTTHHK